MPDLNSWRLEYPGTAFQFGLYSLDYPFSAQVDVAYADETNQDSNNPYADGIVMGQDSLGGMTLTFALTTVPDFPPAAKPWLNALDLFSQFKAKWRADSIRRVNGAYATLTNLDRNRLVYGRPRKCDPTFKSLRRGTAEYVATFESVAPDFYGATEKAVVMEASPGGSTSGVASPVTAPVTTDLEGAVVSPTENEGDVATWPVLEFHGPSPVNGIGLYSGNTKIWNVIVDKNLKYDDVLIVDTRPWRRSATLNGGPANGFLKGSRLEDCSIPPGEFDVVYKTKDKSGQAFATIKWRDGFASL